MAGALILSTTPLYLHQSEFLGGVPFSAFVDVRSRGSGHSADTGQEHNFRNPAIPNLANERNEVPASHLTGG